MYDFSVSDIRYLFIKANFEIPNDQLVIIGLRGSLPVDISGSEFSEVHKLHDLGVNYKNMRCTLIQWDTSKNKFAVFPGSTVPHINSISRGISKGGRGVNQLMSCFLRKLESADHRYYKGDHGISAKNQLLRHRAFRNNANQPISRTSNDIIFDGSDSFHGQQAFDNIHCARQADISSEYFSSAGCQVVSGNAGSPMHTKKTTEQGAWKKFVNNAYDLKQDKFCYALFEQGEAMRTAVLGHEKRSPTVRFGSSGQRVYDLQKALQKKNFDIGSSIPDGEFGFGTFKALHAFQRKGFGKAGTDLIAGGNTAELLGIVW